MTLSKQILLTFLILFVIIIFSGFVLGEGACANVPKELSQYAVCCQDLCDDEPVACQMVVACAGLDLGLYSSAYANEIQNSLNIIEPNCVDPDGNAVCSSQFEFNLCNGNNIYEFYSCSTLLECEEPDGPTQAPSGGCLLGGDSINGLWYYCYGEDGPVQDPDPEELVCETQTPPTGEYNITGVLDLANENYDLYLEDFDVEFTGGPYGDYDIDADGSFTIIDVASGDYVLAFTNADLIEDVCIGCSSPSQSVSVTDGNVNIAQTITATCGITDPDQCSGTAPPVLCNEGECNPAKNSICENGVGVIYNLSIPEQFNYYCGEDQCEDEDPDCSNSNCIENDICDGTCSLHCSTPEEDPDCGTGRCVFFDTVHKWCNQTLGDWMYYPIPAPSIDLESYCGVCQQDSICGGSNCGNGIVEPELGEQCDYGVEQPGGGFIWTEMGNVIYPVDPVSDCLSEFCIHPDSPVGGCTCNLDPSVCHNNITEPGEECEGPNYECDSSPPGYVCDVNTCSCDLLNNDCNFTADSMIDSITVSVVHCSDDLTIEVKLNPNCAQYANQVRLYDCTGESCELENTTVITSTGGQNPSAVFTFDVGTNYNYLYNFSASVHFDEEDPPVWSDIASNKAVTHLSGDEYCVEWETVNPSCQVGWCDDKIVTSCNGSNHLVYDPCDEGDTCSMSTGFAECSEGFSIDECNSCMGLAGMFYTNAGQCTNYFELGNNMPSPCYWDVGYSNINKAESCLHVNSCYDYRSEFACSDDLCAQGYGANACEWVPYNIQTGQGVCKPAIPELEDCSQALSFNSNNVFLFTEIFNDNNFSALSDRVCELYGDCFYKPGSGTESPAMCKDFNEVICNDFVTPESCTGGTDFVLDYAGVLNVTSYSSNIISSQAKCIWLNEECVRDANGNGRSDEYYSDKLFDFMDGSSINLGDIVAQRDFVSPITTIQNFPENGLFGMSLEIPFSIEDDYSSLNVTTFSCLSYQGIDEPHGYTAGQYLPAAINNQDCSFNGDGWGDVDDFSLSEEISSDGYYTIYFFSMDDALNIERLQAVDFQVNTVLPQFEMNYSYVTYIASPDYISTLTIDFEVTSSYSSPLTHCVGYLYSENPNDPIAISAEPLISNVSGIDSSFRAVYYSIEDNTYFYNITCTDTILGNTYSEKEKVIVDGDTRIYDVAPHYETFKAEYVDFSLKTHNNATCYYMLRDDIGIQSSFSNIAECGTLHANDIDQSCGTFDKELVSGEYEYTKNDLPFLEQNGVYVYDVACNISIYNQTTEEYNNVLVVGNSNDRIILAQDYNPPMVYIYTSEDNINYGQYDPSKWYTSPYIQAICVDDTTFAGGSFIIENYDFSYHDLSFGCSEAYSQDNLFYCSLPGFNCPPSRRMNPFIQHLVDPDISSTGQNSGGHIQHICTYGMDNYSLNANQGNTLCRNILFDGVDPNITEGGFNIVRQHGSNDPISIISKAYYTVIVDVDEPLGDYGISFSVPGKLTGIDLSPVYDSELNQLRATLNMFAYSAYLDGIELDDEITMDFTVELTDAHGRVNELSGYDDLSYPIDTSLPAAPILEPLFGSFHRDVGIFHDIIGNEYPVMFHEENTVKDHTAYAGELFDLTDGFYSNQEDLFITGFVTDDDQINISLLSCDQTEDLQFYTTTIDEYDQSLLNGVDEASDEWVNSFATHPTILAYQGNTSIHLNTQLNNDLKIAILNQYKYVKLPIDSSAYSSAKAQGKETTYGNYFKYYVVTAINRYEDSSGDSHEVITISPALEGDLLPGAEIEFYDSGRDNHPEDYFELNLTTPYEFACDIGVGSNLYTLRARSRYVSGLSNDTANINYLIDTAAPEIRQVFSAPAGTTSDTTPTIAFNITEHACGSGLFLGNAKLVLTNIATGDSTVYDLDAPTIGPAEKANLVQYGFTIDMPNLVQAEYEVGLLIEDYAGNRVVLEDNEWIININSSGANKPIVNVPEAYPRYNSWNKIYFVNETPSIMLSSIEFETAVINLQPGNIPLTCAEVPILEGIGIICHVEEGSLTEQVYDIDITALNGKEVVGQWDDIKLAYDVTAPNVTDLDIPASIRSGDKRVFKVYLDDPEMDIVTKIIYQDDSYVLEDTSSNPTKDVYASYLDSTYFGWEESSEPYNFSIVVFDRAMNSMVLNESIYVDDTPPEINITYFESGGISYLTGEDPLNITTRNTTLFINGTVNDSLIKDICLNMTFDGITVDLSEPCQEVCEPGDHPPGCIESGTGNFQFSFSMTLESFTPDNEQVWNMINIIATDEAFNQEVKTLAALMDWLKPIFVNVNIS